MRDAEEQDANEKVSHPLWSQNRSQPYHGKKLHKQNRKTLPCPTALQSKDLGTVKLT